MPRIVKIVLVALAVVACSRRPAEPPLLPAVTCQTAAACAYERNQCRASGGAHCNLAELNKRTDELSSLEDAAAGRRREALREQQHQEHLAIKARADDVEKACVASVASCREIQAKLVQEYSDCGDIHADRCVAVKLWAEDASSRIRKFEDEERRQRNDEEAAERYRQRQENLERLKKN